MVTCTKKLVGIMHFCGFLLIFSNKYVSKEQNINIDLNISKYPARAADLDRHIGRNSLIVSHFDPLPSFTWLVCIICFFVTLRNSFETLFLQFKCTKGKFRITYAFMFCIYAA